MLSLIHYNEVKIVGVLENCKNEPHLLVLIIANCN